MNPIVELRGNFDLHPPALPSPPEERAFHSSVLRTVRWVKAGDTRMQALFYGAVKFLPGLILGFLGIVDDLVRGAGYHLKLTDGKLSLIENCNLAIKSLAKRITDGRKKSALERNINVQVNALSQARSDGEKKAAKRALKESLATYFTSYSADKGIESFHKTAKELSTFISKIRSRDSHLYENVLKIFKDVRCEKYVELAKGYPDNFIKMIEAGHMQGEGDTYLSHEQAVKAINKYAKDQFKQKIGEGLEAALKAYSDVIDPALASGLIFAHEQELPHLEQLHAAAVKQLVNAGTPLESLVSETSKLLASLNQSIEDLQKEKIVKLRNATLEKAQESIEERNALEAAKEDASIKLNFFLDIAHSVLDKIKKNIVQFCDAQSKVEKLNKSIADNQSKLNRFKTNPLGKQLCDQITQKIERKRRRLEEEKQKKERYEKELIKNYTDIHQIMFAYHREFKGDRIKLLGEVPREISEKERGLAIDSIRNFIGELGGNVPSVGIEESYQRVIEDVLTRNNFKPECDDQDDNNGLVPPPHLDLRTIKKDEEEEKKKPSLSRRSSVGSDGYILEVTIEDSSRSQQGRSSSPASKSPTTDTEILSDRSDLRNPITETEVFREEKKVSSERSDSINATTETEIDERKVISHRSDLRNPTTETAVAGGETQDEDHEVPAPSFWSRLFWSR